MFYITHLWFRVLRTNLCCLSYLYILFWIRSSLSFIYIHRFIYLYISAFTHFLRMQLRASLSFILFMITKLWISLIWIVFFLFDITKHSILIWNIKNFFVTFRIYIKLLAKIDTYFRLIFFGGNCRVTAQKYYFRCIETIFYV